MERSPGTPNLADTAAAVSPNSRGDSLASKDIQTSSSQSGTQVDTPNPTSSVSNDNKVAAFNIAEAKDVRVAAVRLEDVELKNYLVPELRPDPDSDQESNDYLASGLENTYRSSILPEWNDDLEERKGRATRLAIQSNLHTQLVEDRLKQLEEDVRMILKIPPKNIDDDDQIFENAKRPLPHRQTVEHLTWAAWSSHVLIPKIMLDRKKWVHVLEIDATLKNVIEVLIEEPQIKSFNWSSRNEASMIDPSLWTPWRIRFRSPLMLKLLEWVTKQKVTIGPHKHQIVILRPFKLLVAYADKIFSFLQELEDKDAAGLLTTEPVESDPASNSIPKANQKDQIAGATGDDSEGDDNESEEEKAANLKAQIESRQALVLMRLLKEVLSKDLVRILKLREGIELGTSKKIFFGDLWHVFRYGQELRSPGPKQIQLYRVLRMTGGRDIKREIWPMHIRQPPQQLPDGIAPIKLKNDGYTEGDFVLECVYFDFDGTQFGPIVKTFIIRKFEGEKDITSLPVYPLTLDPNHVELRQKLLQRGEKFVGLSNPLKTVHKQYQGLTLNKQPEQIESQIIIDFKQAFLEMQEYQPIFGPITLVQHDTRETTPTYSRFDFYKCQQCGTEGCCGNDINFSDYEVDQYFEDLLQKEDKQFLSTFENISEFSDKQKLLLPCRVYGFALRTRKWATFDVDLVKDIEYADSWSNLVIKRTIKETVLALVKNHSRNPEQIHSEGAFSSVDLIRGKGKGLIILLHGEPGVGKTSTAECVAEHTRRPLFPITCGDIGDTAESVEGNLEKNFQLAHKWGCVLLLDEADVFLTRRTSTDLTRNAIVSVFLRTLEYYSGILFLTTNRVGNIDRAFKSRIHVALYYPKLSKSSTYEIWKSNIERIKADFKRERKDFSIDKKDILMYSKEHFNELKAAKLLNWNGRQIRNAFQTAIALAEYDAKLGEKPILSRKQFEIVAAASRDFDEYLKDTQRGKDDAQLAQEEKSRADAWGEYSQNSGVFDEGVLWAPPTRIMQASNASIPPPIHRRNSALLGKKKVREEEVIDEELTDDTVSVTDDDETESEAEAAADTGHLEDEAEGSTVPEGEEEEDEAPLHPKSAMAKAKSKSTNKSKISASKDLEDEETERKPKKKTKGPSLRPR